MISNGHAACPSRLSPARPPSPSLLIVAGTTRERLGGRANPVLRFLLLSPAVTLLLDAMWAIAYGRLLAEPRATLGC